MLCKQRYYVCSPLRDLALLCLSVCLRSTHALYVVSCIYNVSQKKTKRSVINHLIHFLKTQAVVAAQYSCYSTGKAQFPATNISFLDPQLQTVFRFPTLTNSAVKNAEDAVAAKILFGPEDSWPTCPTGLVAKVVVGT